MIKKLTDKKKNLFWIIFFLLMVFIMSRNYFVEGRLPLTVEGHANLGVSWTLRNSILRNGFPGRWDYIGGTSLSEFHPFPMSYFYTGITALIYPNQGTVLRVTILLPIIIAGISMYFFIKLFTGNFFGAVLAGLIYAFNPYFLLESAVSGHPNLIFVYMVFPILVLTFYQAILFNSKIYLLTATVFYTLILLTDAQYGFFSTLLFLFFSISLYLLSIIDKDKFPLSSRRIAGFSLFVFIVSFFLFFFQIVSWFTIKPEVALKGFSQDEVRRYSAPLTSVLSLLSDLPKVFHFSPNLFHFWYIAVAVAGYFFCRNRFRYLIIPFLVFLIIMTMGIRTPVFAFFQNLSPLFSYFRVPFRFLFPVVVLICFLAGYINPQSNKLLSGNKMKFLLLILFILLTLGIFNPPLRWQLFQTFSLSENNPSVDWAELPSGRDKVLYEWFKENDRPGRIAFYQLHPGGIPISMFWSTFHGRRTFDAAVSHVVSQRLFDFLDEVNKIKDGGTLAKLAGILNIRYLIPRDNDYLLTSGAFRGYFKDIKIPNGPAIYENTQVLPFLRTVDYGILVLGENNAKVSMEVLKNKKFDPGKMVLVLGEKQYIDDYEIGYLKIFDFLILAGDYYKEEEKAKKILTLYQKSGQVIICKETKSGCDLRELNIPKVESKTVIVKETSAIPNDHYLFEIKGENKGFWVVLSEPYYSNWRVKLGNEVMKTVPAYGVINAIYLPAGKEFSGSFFYGKSVNQERATFVSVFVFILFTLYFFYLLLRYIKKN